LKRLRRTGGAGGIVSPNASSTRDEPGTRNVDGVSGAHVSSSPLMLNFERV